ncbi:MAG: hypothetical protein NTW94_03670 [Legionellales bacterium]|nr:hypothetical protein [Legionellales bacterium]
MKCSNKAKNMPDSPDVIPTDRVTQHSVVMWDWICFSGKNVTASFSSCLRSHLR